MTRLATLSKIGLKILLACLVPFAVTAATSPLVATNAELARSAATPRYGQMAARTARLIQDADTAGLAAHLHQLNADPDLDRPARERLLRETVLALSGLEPTPALSDAVSGLTAFQARTWIATEEHGHAERYPAYDVAAAAKFVQQRWQENHTRETATRGIRAGDTAVIDAYVGGSRAVRRGLEEAFSAATPAQLATFSGALAHRLSAGQPVAGLAAAAAAAGVDRRLWETVLREAPPGPALWAIARFDAGAWGGQAVAVLTGATRRDEIASAALLKLGPLAGSDPAAARVLFEALDGPHGASAAAALARGADAGIVDQLAGLLREPADEPAQRRALLALRLADDSRAREHLAAFARRPDAPPALVAEVPAWLRD